MADNWNWAHAQLPTIVVAFDGEQPHAHPDRIHYARHVLRIQNRTLVHATDGSHYRACFFSDVLKPAGPYRGIEMPRQSTLYWPVSIGERPEWVVQKASELGLQRLCPYFPSERPSWWDAHRMEGTRMRLE